MHPRTNIGSKCIQHRLIIARITFLSGTEDTTDMSSHPLWGSGARLHVSRRSLVRAKSGCEAEVVVVVSAAERVVDSFSSSVSLNASQQRERWTPRKEGTWDGVPMPASVISYLTLYDFSL
jgi:hypothetical protein